MREGRAPAGPDPGTPRRAPSAGLQEARRLQRRVSARKRALLHHPVYAALRDEASLRIFMEAHVFCVWDFMSLVSALRRALTCTAVPWTPTADPEARRLINEIVLDEESDEAPGGRYLSHFELYLQAMRACGASTRPVEDVLAALQRGDPWQRALESPSIARPVADFVAATLRLASSGRPHEVAAAFAHGREAVIPDMFLAIAARLRDQDPTRWAPFLYYLTRHVEMDRGAHEKASRELVTRLCGASPERWEACTHAADSALRARLRLWDAVLERILASRVS